MLSSRHFIVLACQVMEQRPTAVPLRATVSRALSAPGSDACITAPDQFSTQHCPGATVLPASLPARNPANHLPDYPSMPSITPCLNHLVVSYQPGPEEFVNFLGLVVQSSKWFRISSVQFSSIVTRLPGKFVQFSSWGSSNFKKFSKFSSKFSQFSSVRRSVQWDPLGGAAFGVLLVFHKGSLLRRKVPSKQESLLSRQNQAPRAFCQA